MKKKKKKYLWILKWEIWVINSRHVGVIDISSKMLVLK